VKVNEKGPWGGTSEGRKKHELRNQCENKKRQSTQRCHSKIRNRKTQRLGLGGKGGSEEDKKEKNWCGGGGKRLKIFWGTIETDEKEAKDEKKVRAY